MAIEGLRFLKANKIKNKVCDYTRPYAFISYSHDPDDTRIVREVFTRLYDKGYNLWIDTANIPHNQNDWSEAASDALRNKKCSFAFFFRSESSMGKDTIAEELEMIDDLHHIGDIVTVDIWKQAENTAKLHRVKLRNGNDKDALRACNRICNVVSVANSAIRLEADVQNDVIKLAEAMEEELRDRGIQPVRTGKPDIDGGTGTGDGTGTSDGDGTGTGGGKGTGDGDDKGTGDGKGTGGGTDIDGGTDINSCDKIRSISLPAFLKKYNNNTFKKDTFQRVRLVGQGEYAKYSSDYYPSTYFLVWGFVENLLKEKGEEYIHFVNGKNSGTKNPPFITVAEHERRKEEKHPVTYRRLELPGLEGYSMCRHYSQYDWVSTVLRKRILELGMPLDAFSFAYEKPGQEQESEEPEEPTVVLTEPDTPVKPDVPTGGIKGPVTLIGEEPKRQRQVVAPNGYSFTLYGERYEGLILRRMMLTVFKKTMDRHPDKLDLLLDDLPCLELGDLFESKGGTATFRSGEIYTVNGTMVSIGTSLGQSQVLDYIRRLMRICGEPREALTIDGISY